MSKHEGEILDEKNDFKIIMCNICNFIHILPIPNDNELLGMYKKEYYQKVKPDYIIKDESELDYWNTTFDDRLKIIENNILDSKRILDIGCGAGFFLSRAKTRGWDVVGIEPSKIPSDYAKKNGLTIFEDFFQRVNLNELGKFDAIHMKFFLEHSSNPIEILEKCNTLLNPNGVLVIEVPNDFNPLQKAVQKSLDKNQYWISIPDHINYFNFKSLENILTKTGFKLFYEDATFPLELFLLMGFDYIDNDKIGREKHNERMRLEMNLDKSGNNELKKKLYQSFAQNGIGRTAIVFGKKIS